MSNIEEIERAAERLPLEEFVRLAAWVERRREQLRIAPAVNDSGAIAARDHSAFLNSYAPQDEGLNDNAAAG